MPPDPRPGPTAFVLAGGGTKGSFEVGVLQYLVGVEGIAPDIITATSAGAIAATVLAQARTLPEFLDRVNEIEGDVLAWTQTDHVFGKQAWLGALDGTALGREIHQEITEGTRPPFPLTPSTVLAGNEVVPACDYRPQGAAPGPARPGASASATWRGWWPAPGSGCPGSGASCAAAGARCSISNPLEGALRHGSEDGVRAVDPALVARPGLQLRLAVTALRAGVLRYVTEDGTLVESDALHPRPGRVRRPGRPGRRRHRFGQRAHGLPAAPHGRRRLRRRRGDRDRARSPPPPPWARPASSPSWRCRCGSPRDERDYAAAPAGYIGLRSMGMIGVAERQISNLNVHLPEGTTLTTVDPVVDVVGPVRNRAGAPAHQQGLRLAARRRPPGRR